MQITKITQQVKNPQRVSLFVDDKFYRGIDRLVAMQLGLKVGLTLNPRLIDQLENTQSANQAWEYALRSLQRSSKSYVQMHRRLQEKFGEPQAKETADKLREAGFLDDTKLVHNLVASYAARAKSRLQMRNLLLLKGIPKTIIEVGLAQLDDTHEHEAALRLAQHRIKRFGAGEAWPAIYQKLAGYLARKGYSYGVIKAVLKPELLLADTEHVT